MATTRRVLLSATAGALALPQMARAQAAWPDRPVRLVVPFAPGGGTDLLARVVAQHLGERIGQPVIVENRAGAGGTVGSELVARSAPDGYTLLMGHIGTLAVNPSLYPNLGYDALNGLVPISRVAIVPNMLVVHPQAVAATNVSDFIAAARAEPGRFHYGSGGNGSVSHTAVEALAFATGTRFTHVPYRGTGPMLSDLLAGRTHMTMTGVLSMLPHVRTGALRALGVSTLRRVAALPDVPAIAEAVSGFEAVQWQGIVAPAGVPAPIIARLNAGIVQVLGMPEVQARLATDGAEAAPSTPAEFGAYIRTEITRWAELIRAANITIQ